VNIGTVAANDHVSLWNESMCLGDDAGGIVPAGGNPHGCSRCFTHGQLRQQKPGEPGRHEYRCNYREQTHGGLNTHRAGIISASPAALNI